MTTTAVKGQEFEHKGERYRVLTVCVNGAVYAANTRTHKERTFPFGIPAAPVKGLPGTAKPCECGQHRVRCSFGQHHAWSLAYVDHRTGKPLDKPTFHCMPCDSYCGIDPEDF